MGKVTSGILTPIGQTQRVALLHLLTCARAGRGLAKAMKLGVAAADGKVPPSLHTPFDDLLRSVRRLDDHVYRDAQLTLIKETEAEALERYARFFGPSMRAPESFPQNAQDIMLGTHPAWKYLSDFQRQTLYGVAFRAPDSLDYVLRHGEAGSRVGLDYTLKLIGKLDGAGVPNWRDLFAPKRRSISRLKTAMILHFAATSAIRNDISPLAMGFRRRTRDLSRHIGCIDRGAWRAIEDWCWPVLNRRSDKLYRFFKDVTVDMITDTSVIDVVPGSTSHVPYEFYEGWPPEYRVAQQIFRVTQLLVYAHTYQLPWAQMVVYDGMQPRVRGMSFLRKVARSLGVGLKIVNVTLGRRIPWSIGWRDRDELVVTEPSEEDRFVPLERDSAYLSNEISKQFGLLRYYEGFLLDAQRIGGITERDHDVIRRGFQIFAEGPYQRVQELEAKIHPRQRWRVARWIFRGDARRHLQNVECPLKTFYEDQVAEIIALANKLIDSSTSS